jgi:hypothetical protein
MKQLSNEQVMSIVANKWEEIHPLISPPCVISLNPWRVQDPVYNRSEYIDIIHNTDTMATCRIFPIRTEPRQFMPFSFLQEDDKCFPDGLNIAKVPEDRQKAVELVCKDPVNPYIMSAQFPELTEEFSTGPIFLSAFGENKLRLVKMKKRLNEDKRVCITGEFIEFETNRPFLAPHIPQIGNPLGFWKVSGSNMNLVINEAGIGNNLYFSIDDFHPHCLRLRTADDKFHAVVLPHRILPEEAYYARNLENIEAGKELTLT